jgi:class 3 adenylate cyclase/tetratricopeptide (TPR) repeat protein
MTFDELLAQVRELLQSKGRVSYRALKLQFNLDEEHLEGLKDELIEAERVAVDENGKVLVWVGNSLESRVESQNKSKVQGPKSKAKTPNPELNTAERRQLTVMFCDLVGSTALSEQLDPEEYREVVRGYQQTSATVIERFGGHMAQYLGDGLLVYFGYPLAHEDDAARAVRAGLEIVTALQEQVPSPLVGERQGEGDKVRTLQVRIGIHTGPVVVGEIGGGGKRELLAMGETPNLAARIQGQAAPNEVVMSAATYRLVEGLFECEDRGQPELKGISTPSTLYHVVKESETHSRFEVVVRKGLTPLIGREHEFGLLRERWEQAKSGEGQVVLLSGEPGIGKSRLVEALKESVEHEGASCLELRCSPYHQNSALYPVIAHLQRILQFQQTDSPEEKLRKLEIGLYGRGEVTSPLQKDSIPLLASLLSLPHPDGYPPMTLSPQKQKEKTLEALVAWLCEEAKQQAVVSVWEDLHWADPSTLELLTLFLAQIPTTRLLAVLTFRPEFTAPWGSHSYLSQLTLSRLGRSHVKVMVEKVPGGKVLPREIIQQIVSRTDGVPLFVEELTKMVVEQNVGAYDYTSLLGIPTTLQDALMARLDRLGPAKEIAQLGATIGREFNYELLKTVFPLDEGRLQQRLKQLVEAELVYQRGLVPQAHYLFKHALIQDAAYQSLLKSTRQQYHRQIAQVLAARFPETFETQPELVAHHYTQAGLIEQALLYWQQAGERASQRSAYMEAISHFTKGLELLKALPDSPERVQQELTLQLSLNNALVPAKGYTAPEVEKAVTRARELCQQLGETPQLFPVLWHLFVFYLNRGEFRTALELAELLLRLAERVQDDRYLLSVAHEALGSTLYWRGEFALARLHLEQAIVLYDPQTPPHLTVGTADPRVNCLSYVSWTLWHLGYPDQALKRSSEEVALAEGLSHPYSLAYALGHAAWLQLFRREEQAARERAEAAIALSTEQGFLSRLAVGTTVRGGALTEQGQVEEGIAQLQQSLAAFRAMGAEGGTAWIGFLPWLAAAYARAGRVEEGLSVVAEALAFVDKTEGRFSEAELYRLKGELTLQEASQKSKGKSQKSKVETNPQSLTPNPQGEVEQEAEGYFLKAIEIARKQQAKSLELRATTSLARLRQQQMIDSALRNTYHASRARLDEARSMLSQIYNWFTEGFDTKDLQEAKMLIDELDH